MTANTGLTPPQALDIERVVIGTCLIDARGLKHVYKIIGENQDVFYDPKHKEIYRAICFLLSKNDPVDMMTVIMQLKKTNELERSGGDKYIIDLTMGISSSAHIEFHVRVIWESYLKRKIIEMADLMKSRAYDTSVDVFEVLEHTEKQVSQINAYLCGQNPIKSFFDIHQEFLEYVKAKTVPGIPIPFRKLQEENQGWQNSDLIIIAARPAMGKTALALELGRHAAKNDYPIHFFSLEMANIQLHKRIVANELEISANSIRKKRFSDHDLEKMFACGEFERLPFYYDDSLFIWEEIKARARQVCEEKKTKMIIIDYLQLIDTKRKFSTIDRVSFVSRELKMLAKELNVPVIALSQLSREVEKRPGKKPQLSDLRESGAIEQDADIIIFPYRPEYYGIEKWPDEEGEPSTAGQAMLITAKNRHCGDSEVIIGWKSDYQRFHDLNNDYNENKRYTASASEAFGGPEEMPF
jgi:replicative DNA helicase